MAYNCTSSAKIINSIFYYVILSENSIMSTSAVLAVLPWYLIPITEEQGTLITWMHNNKLLSLVQYHFYHHRLLAYSHQPVDHLALVIWGTKWCKELTTVKRVMLILMAFLSRMALHTVFITNSNKKINQTFSNTILPFKTQILISLFLLPYFYFSIFWGNPYTFHSLLFHIRHDTGNKQTALGELCFKYFACYCYILDTCNYLFAVTNVWRLWWHT